MLTPTPKKGLLVVIAGPTASGKTSLAVQLARHYRTEIISADSRQFFKEIPLGTAAPTEIEMQGIPHHFVGHLSIREEYNVSKFESDVLRLLQEKFKDHELMIMVGGSGLYLDAVCKGIDLLPDPDLEIRAALEKKYEAEGLAGLCAWLEELDPAYYRKVDKNNRMRLMRGIEVCLQTGKPFSQQRLNTDRDRPFHILKIGVELPRDVLVERIHQRADLMMESGWLDEARIVYPNRKLNALNTVGYKELFAYFDGDWSLPQAIEKIKTNTRRYAKRQMTWLRRDKEVQWVDGSNTRQAFQAVIQLVEKKV